MTDVFYAVWVGQWLGLTDEGEDKAPFLFETKQAAEECAVGHGIPRFAVAECSLTRPDLPPRAGSQG